MEWLSSGLIAIAFLTIGFHPAQAAEAATESYAQAIVVGGGRTEDDAKKAIKEFQNADGSKVTPASGFPKILSSDDVPGSPPDTYIAVLGYCDLKAGALVRKIVHSISIGAYSMTVAGKFEDSCPKLAPELTKDEAKPAPSGKKKRDRNGY